MKEILLILLFILSAEVYAGGNITNGNDVTPGKFPWFAALNVKSNPLSDVNCGGVLVAPEWILTAAHCAANYYPDIEGFEPRAIFNMYDKAQSIPKEDIYFGVEKYLHPSWPQDRNRADIALIKLDRPVEGIMPIEIDYKKPIPGNYMHIMGYGIYKVVGGLPQYPDKMQEALTPVQSADVCNDPKYAIYQFIEATEICVGTIDGVRINAALSDSGSPGVIQTEAGDYLLAGIVSRGSPYDDWISPSPGVYTFIATYTEWIYFYTGW